MSGCRSSRLTAVEHVVAGMHDLLLAEGAVLQETGSHIERLQTFSGLVDTDTDGRCFGSEIPTTRLSGGFPGQRSGPCWPFDGSSGRRNRTEVSVTHRDAMGSGEKAAHKVGFPRRLGQCESHRPRDKPFHRWTDTSQLGCLPASTSTRDRTDSGSEA